MNECKEDVRELSLIDLCSVFVKKFLFIIIIALCGLALGIFIGQKKAGSSSKLQIVEQADKNSYITSFSFLVKYSGEDKNMTDELVSQKIKAWWSVFNSNGSCFLQYEKNGLYRLIVFEDSAEKADRLAQYYYGSLVEDFATSFEFKSIKTGESASSEVSQSSYISSLKSEVQSQSKKTVIKYALVCFVAGGIVATLAVFLLFLSKEPVLSSYDFEKFYHVSFLGAFFSQNNIFDRLSRRLTGQKNWKTEEDAVKWYESNIHSLFLSSSKIIVLSTLPQAEIQKAAKNIKYEIVYDSLRNSEANSKISQADVVILFEKTWVSKCKDVDMEIELVNRLKKKVDGFVLC